MSRMLRVTKGTVLAIFLLLWTLALMVFIDERASRDVTRWAAVVGGEVNKMTDSIRIILLALVVLAVTIVGFIVRRAWKRAQPPAMSLGWFCDQLRKEREEEEERDGKE
jgi:hypothetical protein